MDSFLFNDVVAKTQFDSVPYVIDGSPVLIGLVDKLGGGLLLGMSFSEIILGLMTHPAIIICKQDIEYFLEQYGVPFTQGLVAFTIAHEMGHIKQWEANPTRCNGKLETAVDAEVASDAYAVNMGKFRKDIYHKYIAAFVKALDDRNEHSNVKWFLKKLMKLYNHRLLGDRMKRVDKVVNFGNYGCIHSKDDPAFEIAVKFISRILNENEGRWVDD